MRRALLVIVALVMLGAFGFLGWDLAQLGRHTPAELSPDTRASMIVVEKQKRRLSLLKGNDVIRSYAVSLGSDPSGPKQQEGDGRTPEGRYRIDFKNERSRFHLALRVSYPDAADREHAKRRGVSPGGDIMIHGLPNGLSWLDRWHLRSDWTDGCVAVTNAEIEEIWSMVDVGTPVDIRP